MNKTKLSLFIIFLFVFNSGLLAQFTYVGASANYGSWIKEFGASAYVIYSVGEKIDIVANGTYYWPHEENINEPSTGTTGTNTFKWWIVNLDGHYVVYEKSILHVFGLMGLSLTNEIKIEDYITQGQPFNIKTTTNKLGLNIGAGLQLPLSKFFIPFTEIKYTLGDRHQFGVSLGILVRIAPDKIRDEME